MEHHEAPTRRPLFSFGDVVITPGALAAFVAANAYITPYLAHHQQDARGDLDPTDIQANERALKTGARLLSAYQLPDGTTMWMITEADRSSTCVLLPSDY
jgi:phospholipase/lecithinase/hemolysin